MFLSSLISHLSVVLLSTIKGSLNAAISMFVSDCKGALCEIIQQDDRSSCTRTSRDSELGL